jgi:hypothetical protein
MGKFDAAIERLNKISGGISNFLINCDEKVHLPSFIKSQREQLEQINSAIRLLEAAGKALEVSDNSVLTLDTFWKAFVRLTNDKKMAAEGGLYRIRYKAIRALLEALPD